ncbi:putative transposase [Microbacterium profundi]|uniref:Transposase n=1 Tax=Microbacterium profundi TaxID=450380 RepID=A0ABV3LPR4_9MICO
MITSQLPLPFAPAGAVELGRAAALVEDADGGRVYVHGFLTQVWSAGDDAGRRLAAVQLVRTQAAGATQVAAAFGIAVSTLWRWHGQAEQGTAELVSQRRGPKGPSKLTGPVVADVRSRRAAGGTIRQIAAAVQIAEGSVRRALSPEFDTVGTGDAPAAAQAAATESTPSTVEVGEDDELVVLAEPTARHGERGLARAGLLGEAPAVFTPAARVPLAGLLLGLPALAATGLLSCANDVYGQLPAGFYGLSTMFLEGVFRALAGQPRAEGAARFAPADLGRVLGMDRAPEVKTIRRKINQLAGRGKAADLLAAMATTHLAAGTNADAVGVVLYVDGHVRAYQGTKKIAKTHLSRLRFPAPATVETWVSDAASDPVLVVMSEPGASLAMELRRLLPELRTAVGDDRRVLVGFDRGGWSPALFAHMNAHGFDVLTWRKGHTPDIPESAFDAVDFVDENGREHAWTLADTMIDLPITGTDNTVTMRQITRLDTKNAKAKQVHLLTTRTDLPAPEIVYRMGSRWRQENYFRYARIHLGLDAHDSYASVADDPDRSVPNPAKRTAHLVAQNTAARAQRERARTDAAFLEAHTPAPGQDTVVITNTAHNTLTAELHAAEEELATARARHRGTPTRVRLGDLAPGQQVLDTETKLIHHAIKIAAFNTTTTIARDIRINTRYARADQEAYTLTRQILASVGDIIPNTTADTLTIRLDPLPTRRETAAAAELCQHLTTTNTTYPGTTLRLRYEIKDHA